MFYSSPSMEYFPNVYTGRPTIVFLLRRNKKPKGAFYSQINNLIQYEEMIYARSNGLRPRKGDRLHERAGGRKHQ
jgi:hypothetical protein